MPRPRIAKRAMRGAIPNAARQRVRAGKGYERGELPLDANPGHWLKEKHSPFWGVFLSSCESIENENSGVFEKLVYYPQLICSLE